MYERSCPEANGFPEMLHWLSIRLCSCLCRSVWSTTTRVAPHDSTFARPRSSAQAELEIGWHTPTTCTIGLPAVVFARAHSASVAAESMPPETLVTQVFSPAAVMYSLSFLH